MGQGKRLRRALLVEAVSAVAAMVFAVRKSKGSAAAHTHFGIDPLGWLDSDGVP